MLFPKLHRRPTDHDVLAAMASSPDHPELASAIRDAGTAGIGISQIISLIISNWGNISAAIAAIRALIASFVPPTPAPTPAGNQP